MTLLRRVEHGVVVFPESSGLRDGTLVEVKPINTEPAFAERSAVSEERREALLSLIGLWKTESPPDDDEVKRIIEQARREKHG